jgi:hypothetical protein
MGEAEAERLQADVNESLRVRGLSWLHITLDHGSDVTELSSCVDVRVRVTHDARSRDFAIRSYRGLAPLMHGEQPGRGGAWGDLHYCVGGPLCIVNEISGSSIVSVVFHYLCQESHGVANLPGFVPPVSG